MNSEIRRLAAQIRASSEGAIIRVDLESFLSTLRDSDQSLECTQHPLGFILVELTPLADLPANERLRLHIWPHVYFGGDDAGNIHDHTWDLASLVLHGEIRDRNYRPTPDRDGTFEGVRVVYGAENTFQSEGRFDLTLFNDRIISSERVYRIPPRVVHETDVLSAPAVTLVLADESPTSLGPLILKRDGVPSGTAVRMPIASHQALDALEEILSTDV